MNWARLELNQHALAGTRPSTLRVCQFRHEPGISHSQLVDWLRICKFTGWIAVVQAAVIAGVVQFEIPERKHNTISF